MQIQSNVNGGTYEMGKLSLTFCTFKCFFILNCQEK